METMHDRRKKTLEACNRRQMLERHIVQQGISLQQSLGTISAIEYLKLHGVSGAVITRVLSGEARQEDNQAAAVPWPSALRPAS